MSLSRFFGLALAPACLAALAACGPEGGTAPPTGLSSNPGGGPMVVLPPKPVGPAPAPSGSPTPDQQKSASVSGKASLAWTEDATRNYYNGALKLPWPGELGAWRDRTDAAQGELAYATEAFVDRPTEQVVRWDVTELVRERGADILIKRSGGTSARFHSREAADSAKRPKLMVTRQGRTSTYAAMADTSLSSSTTRPLGKSATLSTAGPLLVKFDVSADRSIERAVLELTATTEQYGNQTLDVFRVDASPKPLAAPALALGSAADVVLRIAGDGWRSKASGFRDDRMKIAADGTLTVSIPAGDDTGSTSLYSIPPEARRETMFARVVMKVHRDWTGTMGGKYPGLANTGQGDDRAVKCGWGGRLANGTCWSARTNRRGYVPDTPFAETHQALSPYAYRVNHVTSNGEGPAFNRPLRKGEYFVLDQMVKLNSIAPDGTPRNDGEVAYWLNGEIVGRMTGVIWRTRGGAETLPSEYWLNVYEGGVGYEAPHPHSVSFRDVVVSTKLLPFDAAALARLNGVA
jgi:hypothetical protein